MSATNSEHIERIFEKHLRSVGLHVTHGKLVVLRVLLQTTKPMSASELLYPVKREDINVGLSTVYRTLESLVACGLATESIWVDGVKRFSAQSSAHCKHPHMVCQDCGASIQQAEVSNER
jgi:Fur family ferric uptake transcriptional regulator